MNKFSLILCLSILIHIVLIIYTDRKISSDMSKSESICKEVEDFTNIDFNLVESKKSELSSIRLNQFKFEHDIDKSSQIYKVESVSQKANFVAHTLHQIEQYINNAFIQTDSPEELLAITEQAMLFNKPKVIASFSDKILTQSIELTALQQERMLTLLEGAIDNEHVEALYPYITSGNESVQEEALLRLVEAQDFDKIQPHLDYLASYGLSIWVREEANKYLQNLAVFSEVNHQTN